MPTYMRDKAKVGAQLEFTGPLGSFYLREIRRPLLFLAGGTGLAPFLSMLGEVAKEGSEHPIHMVYGVTNDPDLVGVDQLEAFAQRMPNFTFTCCVADEGSAYPNKGYVTRYIEPQHLQRRARWTFIFAGRRRWWTRCGSGMSDQGVTAGELLLREVRASGAVTAIGADQLS